MLPVSSSGTGFIIRNILCILMVQFYPRWSTFTPCLFFASRCPIYPKRTISPSSRWKFLTESVGSNFIPRDKFFPLGLQCQLQGSNLACGTNFLLQMTNLSPGVKFFISIPFLPQNVQFAQKGVFLKYSHFQCSESDLYSFFESLITNFGVFFSRNRGFDLKLIKWRIFLCFFILNVKKPLFTAFRTKRASYILIQSIYTI